MIHIHFARHKQRARCRQLTALSVVACCLLWLALWEDVSAIGAPAPHLTDMSATPVITDTWGMPLPTRPPSIKPLPVATDAGTAPLPSVTASPVPQTTPIRPPTDATLAATVAATPAPARTPAASGAISGRIGLQGWSKPRSVSLSAAPGDYSATVANGTDFRLAWPSGTYTVTARSPGFFSAQRVGVVVRAGQDVKLPPIELARGDISGDGVLDVADVALVAAEFGRSKGFDPRADVNGDGVVNILDLVLMSGNIGRPALQVWGD